MPIRLIAVDLDGTLLNSRSEISLGNRQAIEAAAARGVRFVVVTGRRVASARPFLEQLPCPATLIASNGAWVGTTSGENFDRSFLPREIAGQVLEATRDYRPFAVIIFDLPGRGQIVMQDGALPEGPLGWYLKTAPEALLLTPDLEAAAPADPVQVMFGGPPAHIEPVEPLLRASLVGRRIHLTWTKYFGRNVALLDVMTHGCSKGRALRRWVERCGINPSDVMAVGDNYNDLEMLEFAGRPVLMSNCSPGLAHDGWAVTLSNDQDGVAAAIRKYVLINEM